jgi:murein DD-endopeptidase MepM/ murein hydrolase activator NlpD
MVAVGRLVSAALALAAVVALSGGSASATRSTTDLTAARAFAVQVAVPGQPGGATPSVTAPPDAVGVGGSFAYPADGSVINAGSVTYGSFANPGASATSSASANISTISIFGGDVTVAGVSAKSKASANSKKSSAGSDGSTVTGLVIQGQPVAPGSGTSFPIGDWGTVTTLQQGLRSLDTRRSAGTRAFVTGLDVRLSADHYGLPAGTQVMIGYAEAGAKYTPAPTVAPKPQRQRQTPTHKKKQQPKRGPGVGAGPEKPNLIVRPPPDVTPRLTAGGYVFPVYGPSSFSDTFGAARGDIVSGWHHGDDIFGQLGEPLLAVADGTVFSVGWNDIGGYRLWLRDKAGNEFYYAHLSAYSPFAVNGRQVKAGTVLGFMGNTGDASTTPYHLHFEIHPVGLLYLGYDGAVNPTSYLTAWKRLEDIDFAQVAGWAPPISPTSAAPKPGAILLSQTDISIADGLDPGSLERTLKQAARTDRG